MPGLPDWDSRQMASRDDSPRQHPGKAPAIVVDVALALAATLLMMRTQLPALLNQLLGIAFGLLTAVHMWQHRTWLKSLTRGRLTGRRLVSVIGMGAVLACTVALVASGLLMSTWATNLGISAGTGGARALHLPLSNLLYCLVGTHAGLSAKGTSRLPRPALVAWVAAAAAGIWSFVALGFGAYIMGTAGFASLDPTKPAVLSFVQYATVFALFALVGAAIQRAFSRNG